MCIYLDIPILSVYRDYQNFIKAQFNDGKMIDRQQFKKIMDIKLKIKHDDSERVKIKNGKKLLGLKASGWWGWKNKNDEIMIK